MSKRNLNLLLMLLCFNSYAQKGKPGGEFQLGMRQTFSLFSDAGSMGMGTGGQFRIQMARRLNTEWFADYIQTDLYNLGKRIDGHIGWSVMFYLTDPYKKDDETVKRALVPYLLAGHCFDYTRVSVFNTLVANNDAMAAKRWSSAAQMGFGTHYNINNNFNLSFSAQYMLHLGSHIETSKETTGSTEYLAVKKETGSSSLNFEGHLLLTLSLNVRIADLW